MLKGAIARRYAGAMFEIGIKQNQIDDAQMALIKRALEKRTGKKIILQTRIEPAILGGVVARVGDQVIDGSVRYRLNALRQQLLHSAASSSADFLSLAGNNGLSAS